MRLVDVGRAELNVRVDGLGERPRRVRRACERHDGEPPRDGGRGGRPCGGGRLGGGGRRGWDAGRRPGVRLGRTGPHRRRKHKRSCHASHARYAPMPVIASSSLERERSSAFFGPQRPPARSASGAKAGARSSTASRNVGSRSIDRPTAARKTATGGPTSAMGFCVANAGRAAKSEAKQKASTSTTVPPAVVDDESWTTA